MIIFNEKEMECKYTLEDNMVFDIRTNYTLPELFDKLTKGEELDENKLVVSVAINGNSRMRLASDNMEEKAVYHGYSIGKDSGRFSFDRWEAVQEFAADEYHGRPEAFAAYESYLYGNKTDGYDFRASTFDFKNEKHLEILRKHLALASGIMPTLYEDKDATYEELKSLSADGNELVRNYNPVCIAKDNPLPDKEQILEYRKLNEYEKRLMHEDYIHPAFFMEMKAKAQEERGAGAVITKKDYEKAELFDITVEDSLLESYKEEFQKQYKFVPGITKEYAAGMMFIRGNNPTKEQIAEDVKNFKRTSIQAVVSSYKAMVPDKKTGELKEKDINVTVAQTRNPALIAMSSMVNFAEMPQQLLRALSVYLTKDNMKELVNKDFPKWLISTGKNEPVSDVIEAIEKAKDIKKFKDGVKARDLVNEERLAFAREQQHKYEQQYHYKFEDNEIAIRGRHLCVTQGSMKMYMLAKDDPRNFTTGIDTHCCQHFGGAGGACVWKLTTDPFAANVVIERNGQILGQAFVWTDETADTFVYDNFEFANDADIKNYLNIIGVYSKHLPYSNVQLGMGYTQGMNGVGEPTHNPVTLPTTLNDRRIYSDYHPEGNYARARDLKRPTEKQRIPKMVKYPLNENICRVTSEPDEPTKWDTLAQPQFAFMLNDCTKSVEERLRLAEEFVNNPTKALQAQVFARNPQAILTIENPDPDLQMEMYEKHPDIAKQIPNPCPQLQAALIADDPNYLRQMENPPEELITGVMSRNGLLLEIVENKTEEICRAAVANNGYAIKFVPEELRTEAVVMEAVQKSPKVASLVANPSPEVQLEAVRRDPTVVLLLNEPTVQAQMSAVSHQPDLVLRLKDPAPAVVQVAVERNPSLIRKYQFQFPEMRMNAIRANGFVIRELKNITPEEYQAAIHQNPAVSRFVQPPVVEAECPSR